MSAPKRVKKVRFASHAGSWYSDDAKQLDQDLTSWLDAALTKNAFVENARAIIAPHAGFSYSGATAAFSYKNLDKSKIKRVFILGPSHHVYSKKCLISQMDEYETPFGNITIDSAVNAQLMKTGHFDVMTKPIDEDEHSIEMQLPYIYKMMQGADYTLVPIMVGSLQKASEELYGSILAPYLQDSSNFFAISSDFCHWGKRFDYFVIYDESLPIYKSIEAMDKKGMELIESTNPTSFHEYLKTYKNTICGRHPIAVLLQAMKASTQKFSVKFLSYAQSNPCKTKNDSSVSYASAVCVPVVETVVNSNGNVDAVVEGKKSEETVTANPENS